ncbi:MAG: hypothetical protein LBT46_14700, partial [Planctomycetaceae bacterium]|nr:hypothetical protein [Planctomycetaceae bacterium]
SGGAAPAPAPAGLPNYVYPGDTANQTPGNNAGVYPNQTYQPTSAVSHPQYTAPVPADSGNYAPFGSQPNNVPVYAAPQNAQPYNAQPYGNQTAPASYAAPAADPYANSAVPAYQPPVSNGY